MKKIASTLLIATFCLVTLPGCTTIDQEVENIPENNAVVEEGTRTDEAPEGEIPNNNEEANRGEAMDVVSYESTLILGVPELCTETNKSNKCDEPKVMFTEDMEEILVSIETTNMKKGEIIDFNWKYLGDRNPKQVSRYYSIAQSDEDFPIIASSLAKPSDGWLKGKYNLTITARLAKELPPYGEDNEVNTNIEPIVIEFEIE